MKTRRHDIQDLYGDGEDGGEVKAKMAKQQKTKRKTVTMNGTKP